MTDEAPDPTEGHTRRSLLRGGLVTGFGAALIGIASPALTGVARAATASPASARTPRLATRARALSAETYSWQSYWAYCANCAGTWYTHNGVPGYCPYQAGGHIKSPSYGYEILYDVSGATGTPPPQPSWSWCSRCQQLFYGPKVSSSYCPAPGGGRHIVGTWNYSLLYNSPGDPWQAGWFWCSNCQALFFAALGGDTGGFCPKTAADHDGRSSFNYDMAVYSVSGP